MQIEIDREDAAELEFVLKTQMAEVLTEAHNQGDRRLHSATERRQYNAMARTLREIVKDGRNRYVPLLSLGVMGGGRLSDNLGVTSEDTGAEATTEYGQKVN